MTVPVGCKFLPYSYLLLPFGNKLYWFEEKSLPSSNSCNQFGNKSYYQYGTVEYRYRDIFFITAVFECIFFPIVQGGRRLSNRDEPLPIDCTDISGASCAWRCQPGEEEVSDTDLCSGYSGFWGWKKCCAPIYGQT
jgi:hypothetical protein